MRISDWSSDVCSSDLLRQVALMRIGKPLQLGGIVGGDPACGVQPGGFECHRYVVFRADPVGENLELQGSDHADDPLAAQPGLERLGGTLLGQLLDRPRAVLHRSEEPTSELQSLIRNSYAVFCLK